MALRLTSTPCCAHKKIGEKEKEEEEEEEVEKEKKSTKGKGKKKKEEVVEEEEEGGRGKKKKEKKKSNSDPYTKNMKLLHRILSSVYGPAAVALDLSIFQITLTLPGGGEGRVR